MQRDSAHNMVTDSTPVLEIYHNSQGRKRTSLTSEVLHYINTGETAPARFMHGYLVAALWSSLDDNGDPFDSNYSIADVSAPALVSAWAECSHFFRDNETDLTHLDDELNGHNFWLTRNHHGSGFWDERVEDEQAKCAMHQLTNASHAFGEVDLYIGDDRKLHFGNERLIA